MTVFPTSARELLTGEDEYMRETGVINGHHISLVHVAGRGWVLNVDEHTEQWIQVVEGSPARAFYKVWSDIWA